VVGGRQLVDVGEGLHPHAGQPALGRPGQAVQADPLQGPEGEDGDHGDGHGHGDEGRAVAVGAEDPAVEHLLEQDRHGHPAGGDGQGQQGREPGAVAQLGHLADDPAEGDDGAALDGVDVVGVGGVALVPTLLDRQRAAHAASSSRS
jgi:hypothetical protein